MPYERGKQSKISLKEIGLVSFNSKDNVNTFYMFFSNFVDSLLKKPSRPKSKFANYKQIRNECEDFVLHHVEVVTVYKILNNLDVAKLSGLDQISAKFLKHGDPVISIHLANIINLPINLDTFPLKRNMAEIKYLF